jgi:hypothetical protein
MFSPQWAGISGPQPFHECLGMHLLRFSGHVKGKKKRLPGAGGGRSELLRQMPRSVGGFISSPQPEDGARAHADTALTANGSEAGSAVGPRGGFNALNFKFKLPSRCLIIEPEAPPGHVHQHAA